MKKFTFFKTNIVIATLSLGITVIVFWTILFYIFSPKSNSYDINNEHTITVNKNTTVDKNIYIQYKDTIAIFLSKEPGKICNIWTKKELTKYDNDLIKNITTHFKIEYDNVIFFYLDSSIIGEDNYYAHFYRENLHSKKNNNIDNENNIIQETIDYCKAQTSINTLNDAIVFLSKVDYLNERVNKHNDISKLKSVVRNYQKKYFPLARKAYVDNAKEKLWKKNIYVKLNGKNIIFTGYMFADNGTIDATYNEIRSELVKFRFKRVSFKWHDESNATYYDLDTKNDDDLSW